jgi:EAL domain-containing protein (putative c-di-GMP-specific phosphodiesterase class I)
MIELVAAGMVGAVTCALRHYRGQIRGRGGAPRPAGDPVSDRSPATGEEPPPSPAPPSALEAELRQALDGGDFVLRYEPVIELTTGRVAAFEALVQWRHWTQGLIEPGAFLPVAEESGLIVPLGAWVLEEACRKLASWRRRFPEADDLAVAVNLSARELIEPGLAERVAGILELTGVPGTGLMVEATEAATVGPTAMANLDGLAALGVGLTLDRVGAGRSTLDHLRRLPVRVLKIDRTLVAGLAAGGGDAAALAAGYLGFGADLGLVVAAVGVETGDQLSWLCRHGCRYGQGFLFADPMDATEADAFLERRLRAPRLVGIG